MLGEPLDPDDDGLDLAAAVRRSDRYEATSLVSEGEPKNRSLFDLLRGR